MDQPDPDPDRRDADADDEHVPLRFWPLAGLTMALMVAAMLGGLAMCGL